MSEQEDDDPFAMNEDEEDPFADEDEGTLFFLNDTTHT